MAVHLCSRRRCVPCIRLRPLPHRRGERELRIQYNLRWEVRMWWNFFFLNFYLLEKIPMCCYGEGYFNSVIVFFSTIHCEIRLDIYFF